ncbi:MAG: hypothetical protein II936_05825 [Oscillospiraceae bacterium]|nr:hypothetical protein [Oscillospiraceae bacterium]
MNQYIGTSDSGNFREAVRGITGAPQLLIMLSTKDNFSTHCLQLKEMYPDTPSIATTGFFYDSRFHNGLGIIAFYGVDVVTGVMRNASRYPIKDINELKKNIRTISPGADNTVCIDFCTGNDACVLTTMYSVFKSTGIQLTGGTAFDGMVAVNGTIYDDADAYALIKNTGKVRVYKENIYKPLGNTRYIASKTYRSRYYIGELNGRPSKQLYMDTHRITERDIVDQTKKNPFGKIVGNEVFIVSLKGYENNGLTCYRQVNDSDVLYMMELMDYKAKVDETISQIQKDFPHSSGSFSVNCIFRYQLFEEKGYFDEYLQQMSRITSHCGFVGNGEHFNHQFINQSMSIAVFE